MYFLGIFGGVLLLVLLWIFLIAPEKVQTDLFRHPYYAHRGLHSGSAIPENTLLAFRKAKDAGFGFEFDIRLTADNRLVVSHDNSLLRVFGVDKKIDECTYEELLQYRAADTDEHIPLFSEVLEQMEGKVPLIIEFKNGRNDRLLCELASALLDTYKGDFCVESFHPVIVRWFRRNRPTYIRGQLIGAVEKKSVPIFLSGLLMHSAVTNALTRPNFIAYQQEAAYRRGRPLLFLRVIRKMGAGLVVWTVRDNETARACLTKPSGIFDVVIFEGFVPESK